MRSIHRVERQRGSFFSSVYQQLGDRAEVSMFMNCSLDVHEL